jgi:teichuronic acid exporter
MKTSYSNKIIKSIKWSALERVTVQILQILMGVLLARMVSPSEFGQVAIISSIVIIINILVEAGFTNALIQKQDRCEEDFSTVFYIIISLSILFYLFIFLFAPYISSYYDEPILEKASKWLGLQIIIQSFSIIQIAKLTIDHDFRTQAKASITAIIVSGFVGIILAKFGYGIWALIIQALMYNSINTFVLWINVKWYPSSKFSKNSLKKLFNFSSKIMIAGLLHSIFMNIYGLIIGKYHSLTSVGYYNQASLLSRFPSVSLMAVIGRAIYPFQCSIQNEIILLSNVNIKYLRMSCYIVFPVMTLLALISEPLINVLLTEKWAATAPLLSILCLAYAVTPIMTINSQIILVRGRSDLFLHAEIIKKIIGVLILVLTVQHDLYFICAGVLLYNLFDAVIIIYFAKKVTLTGYTEQCKAILPHILNSLVMGISIYFSKEIFENDLFDILFSLIVACFSYISFSIVFKLKEYIYIKEHLNAEINNSKVNINEINK